MGPLTVDTLYRKRRQFLLAHLLKSLQYVSLLLFSVAMPHFDSPNIHEPPDSAQAFVIPDDDSELLTELDTADIPVPTSLQETNSDSVEAHIGAASTLQPPFEYAWVNWQHPALVSCRRLAHNKRTRAISSDI